jgi:hypothetical protein
MSTPDPQKLKQKVQNAIEVSRAFVAYLEEIGLQCWAERFTSVVQLLEAQDVHGALHLLKQHKRFVGPGSLSDVMLDDQQIFYRLWGAQSRSMENLRLYIEYGTDRPPVVV